MSRKRWYESADQTEMRGGWEWATPIYVKDCGCIIPSVASKKKIRYCKRCREKYPLTTHPVSSREYQRHVRRLVKSGRMAEVKRRLKAKNHV